VGEEHHLQVELEVLQMGLLVDLYQEEVVDHTLAQYLPAPVVVEEAEDIMVVVEGVE
jgi:hypothetical protein